MDCFLCITVLCTMAGESQVNVYVLLSTLYHVYEQLSHLSMTEIRKVLGLMS